MLKPQTYKIWLVYLKTECQSLLKTHKVWPDKILNLITKDNFSHTALHFQQEMQLFDLTLDNPLPRTKAHDQDPLYLVNRPTIGSNKSTFNKYSNLNSRKMTGMGWGHVDDLKNIEQPLV